MNYVQHTTTVAVVCKCESFYSARSLLLNFVIQFSLCVCVYNFRNHLSICSKKLARSDNIKLLTTKMEIINVVLTASKQSIWYGWMDIQSKGTENDLKLPICYLLGWEEAPEHFFRRTAITSPDCQEFMV